MLVLIFILALILRFLHFPNNIYFGFDQARDAFAALEIIQGNLRVVGPPTGVDGWFHGVLYYYLYAPFYFISSGNPEWAAAFLRVANALGIFLVFLAASVIFNKKVGILAALLFAISFEQTQYALYFNHPSLAVLSVTLFYLGLSLLFFKKEPRGLILALFGLGLSLQFEFVLVYLVLAAVILFLVFRKSLMVVNKKSLLLSIGSFFLIVSTFIIVEIKSNFRSILVLLDLVEGKGGLGGLGGLGNVFLISRRLVEDNLVSYENYELLIFLLLAVMLLKYLRDLKVRVKIIFLLVWFLAGSLPYLSNKSVTPLYYYSVGAGVGLLIFYSFVVSKVWEKWKVGGIVLLAVPIISNVNLIKANNYQGVIPTINVQSGMLLSDEKKVVDYIYQQAFGKPFSASAVTMPLSVNTTWSYLFEWYGQGRYGYLPLWGENAAAGYPGNLKVITSKSTLPKARFLIIEPTRGIRQGLIDNFMREESYFTKVVEEEKIGDFIVQKRELI